MSESPTLLPLTVRRPQRADARRNFDALIAAAREVARRARAAQLVWTVDRRNAQALKFYEGLGADRLEGLALMCLDCSGEHKPPEAQPQPVGRALTRL